MGTTADKLARLNTTKTLLKNHLFEKGLDVAGENNFYNLANMVGNIPTMKSITVTGDGTNKIVVPFSIDRFFICALKRVSKSIISGLYNNPDINIFFHSNGLIVTDGTFTVDGSESETTISGSFIYNFADGAEYIIYYW